MITFRMLSRPVTFRAIPRAQLSSLHSADCSLLDHFSPRRSLKSATYGLPTVLVAGSFSETGGGYAQYRVASANLRQVLCCLLHTCKPSLFIGLQTLLRNGKP